MRTHFKGSMLSFLRKNIAIILIVILASVVRLFQISSIPVSLYWEEVALGYDAYSIAQTGKDHHGNVFPLLAFPSFGDYKPSGYFYAVVPFVKLFGLTPLAVRFPSALAGIFTTLAVYWIASHLFSKRVGTIAALLFAIQPWNMHISRVGFETNLATCFVAYGVLFGLKAKKRSWFYSVAAFFFGLSMYTYHSARIVAPVLGLLVVLYDMTKLHIQKNWKALLFAAFIGLFFALPIVINMKNPVIAQRAAETSIFSDIKPIEESNRLIQEDGGGVFARIIHHRYIIFARLILLQATKNFDISFLFFRGDDNLRHQTQEFGLLYHWELLSLLACCFFAMRQRTQAFGLLFVWAGIASLLPAMTTVSPHTLRFLLASPVFAIASAVGCVFLYDAVPWVAFRKMILALWIVVCFGECVWYMHYYFAHYGSSSASMWQYGYQQLFQSIRSNEREGEQVFITREQGRPAMYDAFLNKLDPRIMQEESAKAPKDQLELLQIKNHQFVDALPNVPGLYATSPTKKDAKATLLDEIKLPTGEVVWTVWRKE